MLLANPQSEDTINYIARPFDSDDESDLRSRSSIAAGQYNKTPQKRHRASSARVRREHHSDLESPGPSNRFGSAAHIAGTTYVPHRRRLPRIGLIQIKYVN